MVCNWLGAPVPVKLPKEGSVQLQQPARVKLTAPAGMVRKIGEGTSAKSAVGLPKKTTPEGSGKCVVEVTSVVDVVNELNANEPETNVGSADAADANIMAMLPTNAAVAKRLCIKQPS